MSKTKAIIFDIDGTAVDSPKKELPSSRLAAAIDGLKDEYYLSAATGRSWTWAKDIIEHLNLDDPCIVAAGTQICDPKTGETLWQSDMDTKDIEEAMDILKTIRNCRLLYNDYSGEDYFAGGLSPDEVNFNEPVYFINCIFIPEDDAEQVMEKLDVVENLAITLAVSQKEGYKDILITHKLATKEHAIGELLKIVGVEKRDATGVGDGDNDLELFKAVGHKVAMGNGVPGVKEAADEVIAGIEDDGFAEYLEGIGPHD